VKSSPKSKVNSPQGPRVITTYSPLDEAIALLPQIDRRRGEHGHQLTTVDLERSSSPRLGLRPVVDWGARSGEGDELGSEQKGYGAGRTDAQIDALSNDVSPDEVNAEDDEDAEGEQEDAVPIRSSRSRSPPSPHPGASPDSNNDDPDAEGEMEFEENQ
jgi:hypothetical protein